MAYLSKKVQGCYTCDSEDSCESPDTKECRRREACFIKYLQQTPGGPFILAELGCELPPKSLISKLADDKTKLKAGWVILSLVSLKVG